jgi:hypothetical protein
VVVMGWMLDVGCGELGDERVRGEVDGEEVSLTRIQSSSWDILRHETTVDSIRIPCLPRVRREFQKCGRVTHRLKWRKRGEEGKGELVKGGMSMQRLQKEV